MTPRRPKTHQRCPKTPLDALKTPYFDYNLYKKFFSEMKKSISPKTQQNAPRRTKTPRDAPRLLTLTIIYVISVKRVNVIV